MKKRRYLPMFDIDDVMYKQLWNASQLVYDAGNNEHLETEEQWTHAGYIAQPFTFQSGVDNIDAGMVGSTQQGLLIAFRGTKTLNGYDWAQDFNAEQVPYFESKDQKVHDGFNFSVNNLLPRMIDKIKELIEISACTNPKIYITGHSKGGALASLAAKWLQLNGVDCDCVYTFAAPRVGNDSFAAAYNIPLLRFESFYDFVTHVPFSAQEKVILERVPIAEFIGSVFCQQARDNPLFAVIADYLKVKKMFNHYVHLGKRVCVYLRPSEVPVYTPYLTKSRSGETLNSFVAIINYGLGKNLKNPMTVKRFIEDQHCLSYIDPQAIKDVALKEIVTV